MTSPLLDLLYKIVPQNLQKEVCYILESCKIIAERNLGEFRQRHKRYAGDGSEASAQGSPSDNEREREVEEAAAPLTIVRVIFQLWTSKMYRHAESVILNKVVEEKYIEEKHLKYVYVFEEEGDQYKETDEWIIEDQDEAIVELVWNIFNIKEFFDNVYLHRSLVQKSYDRFKEFVPELHPDIIDRHDLSKYAFSTAIGFTLKIVHKIFHPIWQQASSLHIQGELHHPQAWSRKYSPEQKQKKLKDWMKLSSNLEDMTMIPLDPDNESLPLPFLLESYIDMVAIEWERRKNQRPDITDSELIYMDEKFLSRYTSKQRKVINDLVNKVMSFDDSWKEVSLTERETRLISLVPERQKGPVIFRLGDMKKREMVRLESESRRKTSNVSEEMERNASDFAFCHTLAIIMMYIWSSKFRKHVEGLVLKRAIKEDYIEENHLKWICFAEESEESESDPSATASYPGDNEGIVELIWEDYNMREHFSQTKVHRYWVRRSYDFLSKFVPELPEEVIERHDLSKFSFSQAVGYTLKWVHDIYSPIWQSACEIHLNVEPHHPQMWKNRHSPEYKQSCLESFFCLQAGDAMYGIQFSQLNLNSEDMAMVFLLESYVDMVAREWEKNKDKEGFSEYKITYMEDRYLTRYSWNDRTSLRKIMQKIQM